MYVSVCFTGYFMFWSFNNGLFFMNKIFNLKNICIYWRDHMSQNDKHSDSIQRFAIWRKISAHVYLYTRIFAITHDGMLSSN